MGRRALRNSYSASNRASFNGIRHNGSRVLHAVFHELLGHEGACGAVQHISARMATRRACAHVRRHDQFVCVCVCVYVRLLCARMCLAVASVRVRVRASTAGENAPPARTQPPRRAKQAGRGCPFVQCSPSPSARLFGLTGKSLLGWSW